MSAVLTLVGAVLLVLGVGLLSVPVAVALAGALTLAAGLDLRS